MADAAGAHRKAVAEFVDRVRASELDSIRQLRLFGSVARGEPDADSDIDVLAVIDDSADPTAVEERLREIAYALLLEQGAVFNIHAVTHSTLESRRDHPFFQNVFAEGEQIYG